MSGQIAHAMEDAARKAEQGLAQDFTKAYHSILKDTEQKTTQVAEHVAENEAKTVEDLGKSAEHATSEPHEPHPDGGGPGPRSAPEREDSPCGREQVRDPHDAGRGDDALCPGGEPVDMATGRMFIEQVDTWLPGVLPLGFARRFESGYQAGRWMGRRWVCTFDERLEIDDQGVVHIGADGRTQAYPHPGPGESVQASAGARRDLESEPGERGYLLTDRGTGLVREFVVQPGGREALLTKVRNRTGDHYTLEYDREGTPQGIRHTGGYELRVTVADGRIVDVALAGGSPGGGDQSVMRYGYTEGYLSEVYNSSGLPLRFANDAWGRVTSWTDRNGSRYEYTYDALGRVVEEGGSEGHLHFTFGYGTPDLSTGLRRNTETDALGRTTVYEVNARHQITAITDPLGNTTRYERDERDLLLAETDPLGRTTRYQYDTVGDLVEVVRPDGGRATAAYHGELSLPVAIAESGGALWRQTYDEAGLRASFTDPTGAVTRYGHDGRGHLASVTDPFGHTTLVTCDTAGLPIEVTDPSGAVSRCERDAFGRITAMTSPLGEVERFTWTVEGFLASRTAPDGTTQRWTYDGEGNMLSHTDELGRVSTFEYSHFETLAARTGPDGARIAFTHDAAMQLVAVTNPLGQQWTYAYDSAGRLIGETDFQRRTVGYELDGAGQVLAVTNPAGETTRYEYDLQGRPTTKNAAGRVTTYTYDALGHLVRATNPDADVVRTVDAMGNLLTETVNGRTLTLTRDVLGRRVRRTTPVGHASNWSYDAVGRPTVLATSGGSLDFAYDIAGREQRRVIGEHLALVSTWDVNDRLTDQNLEVRGRAVQQRAYRYRVDGSVSGIDDRLSGRRSFDLDAAGRVTAVHAANWAETYAYDPVGNLTSAGWPATRATEAALGARSFTGSELTTAGHVRYEYDAAGRTVLRQVRRLSRKPDSWHYTWDAEDRLTDVITPDGTHWRYLYDPFGRRTAKQRVAADSVTVAEWTEFTWDGYTLAEQTTHAPYLPGPHTLSWEHNGLHPVAQTETVTVHGVDGGQDQVDRRFFAIVTDLVGTPTELVDPSTEAVAWRATTTLWGQTTWPSTSTTYTPLRFPGQYFDPETRLHYNLHRYYDPETARYATPDPLGLVPDPNPDTYVANPHSWSDPLGLSAHARDSGNLSEPLPQGMSNRIAQAYDDLKAGRLASHDTYGGAEHPWWAGAKEYRVPGGPNRERLLVKTLPNGVKAIGWTSTHYRKIQRFEAPHFPDWGWK